MRGVWGHVQIFVDIRQFLRTTERAAKIHAKTVRTCGKGLGHMKDLSTTIWNYQNYIDYQNF